MKNWPEIVFNSHYQTAIEVKKSLEEGDVMEAEEGIDQLIDAMARADRRAVKSQLARLMKHIVKWYTQPEKRSVSWVRSILNARTEIQDIQQESPSITDKVIDELWERVFNQALAEAEEEMGNKSSSIESLTWNEVFDNEYLLGHDN